MKWWQWILVIVFVGPLVTFLIISIFNPSALNKQDSGGY